MSKDTRKLWRSGTAQQLAGALTGIVDEQVMKNFLSDILTEREIVEIGARLEAARMLSNGERYTDIIKQTKLSSRTVARISDWLQNGCNGYQAVLETISNHDHISPARAE
jgi:TrpR-related protein YerC/YecD